MKTKLFSALPAIVIGLLIAVGPQTFVKVCKVMDKPMKCHWMAQASLGIGAVVAVLGIVALLVSASVRIGLNIAVALLGALEVGIATFLIGPCKMPEMHCHSTTQPFLIVVSVLLMIFALISVGSDIRANGLNKTEASN